MNRWIFLAALFCAVAGSRQFRNNARSLNGSPYGQVEQHKAVQNGQIDPKKMVEVFLSNDKSGWACGGTILGGKYVLTAAHCFFDRSKCGETNPETIKASFPAAKEISVFVEGVCQELPGRHCKGLQNTRRVGVRKLSAPLAYAANCTSSDVVVLELEEQLASPGAQLNTQENPTTGSFFASGFGEDRKFAFFMQIKARFQQKNQKHRFTS